MERSARIEETLRRELAADPVLVVDESHLHAGHAGARGGAGHFRAVIVSARFEGLGPVERQRLVYAALADLLGREIHALSLQTLTPAQWRERSHASRAAGSSGEDAAATGAARSARPRPEEG